MEKLVARSLFGLVAALAVTGLPPAAEAVVEAPQNAQLEIPLLYPDYDPLQLAARRLAAANVEASVSERLGGTWQVPMMNTYSNTPRYVLGSGVELGVDASTDEAAIGAAFGVVTSSPEVFGSRENTLEVNDVRRGAGKVAVHFQQTYYGLEVWGARAHVTMTESGRAYALKSNIFDDITIDTTPAVSEGQAEAIAKSGVGFDIATDSIDGDVELIVLPFPVSPVDVDHRLAWRIRVETTDPVGIWVTHIDAQTGDVLWRYNDVHFLQVSGSMDTVTQPVTYCDGTELQDAPYQRLEVVGLGTTNTDSNGNWNLGDGGTGTYNVESTMIGPYCRVQNQNGANALFTGTVTAGTPLNVSWNGSNSQQDERTVFDSVADVHDFFELFDPGYTYSNFQIAANVSINQNCNAFWNGTINFYTAGGGCANTGEIAGVVHHEFGHGVQDNLIGFQGNEGLGEGNSDILANFITRESIIGRGFSQGACSSGIRNSDNTRQYPGDLTGQVHNDGMIIAGFNWDLMENMQAQYGTDPGLLETATIWHFARKVERPTNQPDQVIAYFVADDDDGDLLNGTPNYGLICDAASLHGFEDYCPEIVSGVVVSHTPDVEFPADGTAATLTAFVTSTEAPIDDSTVFVNYTKNGGSLITLPMTPTGTPDEYSVTMPSFSAPTTIEYYLSAEDDLGNAGFAPRTAPADTYGFDYPTMFEPFEVFVPGWIWNPDGTDDANDGIWERADPQGTPIQPENDHTPDGTHCWVTGDRGPGVAIDDVDLGTTTLRSPIFNANGAFSASLSYFRYFHNDDGGDPWVVQVRNDGGPWVDIERTEADQDRWVRVSFDLFAEWGEDLNDIEVQFIAKDSGGFIVEALVDDFSMTVDLDGTVDVEIDPSVGGIPSASYLAAARPNPFNPRTTIGYGLESSEKVTLAIYDVNGRRVRSLVNTTQAAGNYAVVWDGRDDAGRDVASGVYYSRVVAGSFASTSKLNLLK